MDDERPLCVEQSVVPLEHRLARGADGRCRSSSDSSCCLPCSAISRQAASGRDLPRRGRARRTGAPARAAENAGRPPPSFSLPAMGARGLERCRRPRRDDRRAAVQHVSRRAGRERGQRAEPRGPVSGSRHQAVAGLQARRAGRLVHADAGAQPFRPEHRRHREVLRLAAEGAHRTCAIRRDARRPRWFASATRCATLRRASDVTAGPITSSARRGSRACRRSISSSSSRISRPERVATTATRRCAT